MKAIYTKKPERFEKIDTGTYYYRWKIKEIDVYNPLTNQSTTQWECEQFKFSGVSEDDLLISTLEEIALKRATEQKLNDLTEYDCSDSVNIFYFKGTPIWLDKSTRVGLMNSTTIEKTLGRTETEFILGSISVVLPVDSAIQMLYILEVYAKDCYNTTAKHRIAIENIKTIEGVLEYDFTQGYPDKPNF